MSDIQLDLSLQKLYVSPHDNILPEFDPPPHAIEITPIYDTRIFENQLSPTDTWNGPPSPWIVNRSSDYQESSTRRHDDHRYARSPAYDQRHDPRDRYPDSYSRDHSRRRRSSDYPDDGRFRDDYSDYDRSSSYDYPSEYDHPPDHDRRSSDYDRSAPQRQRPSSYQPHHSSTNQEHKISSYITKKLFKPHIYPNLQTINRDPFKHLKNMPEEIQRVLKALPPSPHFCWSDCTGKRKAVCVGINYTGQKNSLKGCANDARNMRSFLVNYYGFKPEDVLILTDDGKPTSGKPTRENMFNAMRWLIKDTKKHDSLFFHYSGHGGQVKDESGKELDGMDEVIFPLDFKSTSYIVDDDLNKALVTPLPSGCRLTAVFDSCHSGTVLDLPYLHSAHGRLRSLGHITRRAQQRKEASSADVICFAGCKDDETSADTFQGGVAVGAMSNALLTILKANAQQNQHETYAQILKKLRDVLVPKYRQKPQISGTHPVDLDRPFIL